MRTQPNRPIVAITVGDFNGIGPEVTLKSVRHPSVRAVCMPLLVGPMDVFSYYARRLRLPLQFATFDGSFPAKPTVLSLVAPAVELSQRDIDPGTLSPEAGRIAAEAIAKAVELVKSGTAHALVTAPVSKQALHLAQVDFPGQTEMLQRLSDSPTVAMMLVYDSLRVGLATIHIPIRKVSEMLSRPLLRERIITIFNALRTDWRIRSPRLAVLALNPHASEGGDIGTEDLEVVGPVVDELRKARLKIEGPFPADAFFGRYKPSMYDAIVAMYHDQGLIPLKMASSGRAVNISVGLNIVRTSPDHGTAFDIAGKGIADPGSMIEAIRLAAQIAMNRGVFRTRRKR